MKPFKSPRTQSSFHDIVHESLVDKKHLLSKLNQILDWSFIEDECRPLQPGSGDCPA